MATFEESFLYPLILLLVGAGVSGLLVAWLTNRWQDRRREREIEVEHRRKELEIKVDIASKISEAIAYQDANSIASTISKKETLTPGEKDAYYENTKKWYIDVSIISSKLESYFSDSDIRKRWENYFAVLLAFSNSSFQYFYEDPGGQKDALRGNLERIRKYFSDNDQLDWNHLTTEMTYDEPMWDKVGKLVMQRGDEIIRDVLKHPIKVF
jgi:hypothetical protein